MGKRIDAAFRCWVSQVDSPKQAAQLWECSLRPDRVVIPEALLSCRSCQLQFRNRFDQFSCHGTSRRTGQHFDWIQIENNTTWNVECDLNTNQWCTVSRNWSFIWDRANSRSGWFLLLKTVHCSNAELMGHHPPPPMWNHEVLKYRWTILAMGLKYRWTILAMGSQSFQRCVNEVLKCVHAKVTCSTLSETTTTKKKNSQ